MQAERDQQPVQHAVAEGAERGGEQFGGEQGDALFQQRPEQREGKASSRQVSAEASRLVKSPLTSRSQWGMGWRLSQG